MPSVPYRKKIRTIQLVAIVFFTVSGGPYGLEPLLAYAGDHAAFMVLLITPLLWDVPAIFTVLELNAMMPVTGGYYKWVRYALGNKWGFYEGWWTWLYTFVDLAVYPILFLQYASYLFPELAPYKIPVCLCVIWISAGLNILGILSVGRTSLFLGAMVLTPFLIMFGLFFYHHAGSVHIPHQTLYGTPFPSLSMALYTVMWNCLGWDNTTTYAEEVEKPIRSYLISTFSALGLLIVVYFLAIWVAQASGIKHDIFTIQGFPALATKVAGRWLGVLVAIGGMASALGIYAAVLLSVSRVPQVMSEDSLLPAQFNKLHQRFQTPYISIITCSVVVSLMILWTFADLLIIDVTVYGAGLALEYIALIKLRIREPDRERPFKIPLSTRWLIALLILPASVYFIALSGAVATSEDTIKPAIFAIIALVSAEAAWQLIKLRRPKGQTI
jgi:amino acid transporter